MEKHVYPRLGEEVFRTVLSNGLTVVIVPRPGFTKKLAYFVTDFGAIHTEFTLDGELFQVPAGIAHYLEHKLFDMPQRDVTAEFAALGAVPNAFTSYDMTAYYFSCTENFQQALELLLEFVSTPYFTAESVQKEQGIIGQEIGMNLDNPDSRMFEQLMEIMYARHPVRIPILGTKESIAQITPELLTSCHRAFYRPDNMLLCVVGDVDREAVVAAAEKLTPSSAPPTQAVRRWQELPDCPQKLVTASMEVAMPMLQLGFKCPALERGAQAVRTEITAELAAEALFGESSQLYMQLYQDGLIDSSFGGGFETIEGMAILTASGDSDDPEGVQDAILRRTQQLLQEGIGQEEFLRMKRSAMGRRIRALDSFNSVCFRVCAYHFSGFDYFDFPAIYQDVTVQDVLDFLAAAVTEDSMCMSIIYPKEEMQ